MRGINDFTAPLPLSPCRHASKQISKKERKRKGKLASFNPLVKLTEGFSLGIVLGSVDFQQSPH